MLPEIGASELLVIAAVALIVVGPKDLPVLLRRLGQFMAKLRGMAAEFRASFDEMARQSELDELRAQVDALRKGQLEEIAALRADEAQVAQVFDEIGQGLHETARYDPPAIHEYAEPAALPPGDGMPAVEPEPAPPAKPKTPRARAKPKPKAEPTVSPAKAPAKPRTKRTGTVT